MALILLENTLPSRFEKVQRDLKRKALRAITKSRGWIGKLFSFGSFAWAAISKFLPPIDFSTLWDTVVNAYFTLKFFDWNATDKSLQDTIEANNKAIVTAAATHLGTTAGWGLLRLANLWIGKFKPGQKNLPTGIKVPVLSARIGAALAEEGGEETRASLYSFLATARRAMISNSLISALLTVRRNEWFGMKSVTEAQSDGSIAGFIDKQIEKLPEFWRQPVEEMIDSFEDAIMEGGYVVAYQIDDHVAAVRAAQAAEPIRTVDVEFADSDERLSFAGPQTEVKQAIVNALATRDLLNDRDVGQILGSPFNEEDWNPKFQIRQLKITYSSRDKPPLWIEPEPRSHNYKEGSSSPDKKRKNARRAEVTIPDVKPGLSWRELKDAAGTYQRGNHLVRIMLESGHEIQVWAGTPAEGKEVLLRLAKLSNCKPLPGTIRSEEVLDLEPGRKKPIEKMHVVHCCLLHRKNKTDGKGNFAFDGKQYNQDIKKIDLWPDTAPADFKPLV